MSTVESLPTGSAALSAGSQQYVSFLINGELLGVPVSVVQEVLTAQKIAETPLARVEVAGLLNLRGQIVTAVNLRRRLGLPEQEDGLPSMNVVVRQLGESFSLLVDDVGDVITVEGEHHEPAPRTLDPRWRSLVTGVIRLEGRLLVILDLNAVLTFDNPRGLEVRN